MVGFEVQKQGKYVNIPPDRVNNSDLEVLTRDEKHVFLQFNFSDRKLPMQGFKIHISANLSNYQVVLNTVFSFCKVNSITFKYICNSTLLEKNIRGSDGDPTFSGKFITIYPATFNLFKTYIDMLYNIQELKTDSSIFVMTDRRYKDSNNIFYRYGAISRKDGYIVSPKGNKIRDSRKIGYQLPSFINEPFPNNYDDNLKGRYIFKKYIPKNSSGSVFEVTNKYNNNVFIMKNAKVGFGDESYSVIDLLKKEKNNLINLRKANIDCIPKYIDDFYEDKDYFLIETKIDGENGDDFRASIKNNFKDGMLREIFDRFKKNAGTKIYFELEQGITKFSPYLANGTAGILVLLLLYKRKFHTSLWDKEIKECVSSIKDISMPKSGGMYYGLAGIIYSLIMYTTVYKDKSFSSAIRTMLNNLQFYTINIDNTLFLIDGTFHNVNVSFPDGNLGLINVIKMYVFYKKLA